MQLSKEMEEFKAENVLKNMHSFAELRVDRVST